MNKLKDTSTEISLLITNNTVSNVPMSFFGNMANIADISNQYTEYSYDITALILSVYNTISITFRNAGSSGAYTTLTTTYTEATIEAVLDALNAFDISCFYSATVGANEYIRTYNDNVEFADISFTNPAGYPNYYLYYRGDNVGAGGSWSIDNPSGTPIASGVFPISISSYIDLTDSLTSANVEISGIAGSEDVVVLVTSYNLSTGATATVQNVTVGAGLPILVNFTMSAGFAYYINLYVSGS